MKNCCANCEWNISPTDEDNILKDMGYEEDDENRPHAGDCCLCKENERVDYYCNYYSYQSDITYLVDEKIVNNPRHEFIYSYDGNGRDEFICEMCDKYPFNINNNLIVVNVDDFNITNTNSINNKNIDKLKLSSFEYLNLSICYSLVKLLNNCEDFEDNTYFLSRFNRLFVNDNCDDIKNMNELLNCISISMNNYKNYYNNLINNKRTKLGLDSLKVPFVDLLTFTRLLKKSIGYSSYFVVIFNCNGNVPVIVSNTINSLISNSSNKDISVKVVCDFNNYKNFYDLNNNIIQKTHDCDIVELDDNYSDSMKLIRRKYENN